jgi:hypothetical protein
VPLTAGVALTAAVLGFFVGGIGSAGGFFGNGTVDDLAGSMVLELQDGAYVQEQAASDQAEYRGEDWKGTITIKASASTPAQLAWRAPLRTCPPTRVRLLRISGAQQK